MWLVVTPYFRVWGPPRVLGHVAADGAGVLAGGIGRVVQAVAGHRPGEVGVDHAGPHPGLPVGARRSRWIWFIRAVQMATLSTRHRPARQPGARAAGQEGHACGGAGLHDGRHLRGGLGEGHRQRQGPIQGLGVALVGEQILAAGHQRARPAAAARSSRQQPPARAPPRVDRGRRSSRSAGRAGWLARCFMTRGEPGPRSQVVTPAHASACSSWPASDRGSSTFTLVLRAKSTSASRPTTTANHSVHSRVTKVAAAATPWPVPVPSLASSASMPASVTPSPPGRNDSAPGDGHGRVDEGGGLVLDAAPRESRAPPARTPGTRSTS